MQYGLLKFVSRILCFLPRSFLLAFGAAFGRLYYVLAGRQRDRAVRQMVASLGVAEKEARALTKASFINIGKNFLEIMYMPTLTRDNFTRYIEIDHLERLQAALAEGHGVVVLTAHVGNWEWLSAGLSFSGLPVTAIAKAQPNDQHTRLLNEFRAAVGVEIFSRGTTELVSAAKALKKGKILGFLADQDAGPGGAFVDFLGFTASTPLGPAVFSKRFHAPIIPAFIVRKPDGNHKILILEQVRYEDSGDEARDLQDVTVRMTRVVEDVIKQYPTQWLWFQKRWNTTPDMKKEKHPAQTEVQHE